MITALQDEGVTLIMRVVSRGHFQPLEPLNQIHNSNHTSGGSRNLERGVQW